MSKSNFYSQLKQEEKDLLETLRALQVLIKRYEEEMPNQIKAEEAYAGVSVVNLGGTSLEVTNESYDKDMTISKKILYSLKQLKKGTSKEVGENAFALDNSRPLQKWIDDSRFYLSKYYNEKKLIVLKDANVRGNVYAFPL